MGRPKSWMASCTALDGRAIGRVPPPPPPLGASTSSGSLHTRTVWSREPEARTPGRVGWKRTTQGVRACPDRIARGRRSATDTILTV